MMFTLWTGIGSLALYIMLVLTMGLAMYAHFDDEAERNKYITRWALQLPGVAVLALFTVVNFIYYSVVGIVALAS